MNWGSLLSGFEWRGGINGARLQDSGGLGYITLNPRENMFDILDKSTGLHCTTKTSAQHTGASHKKTTTARHVDYNSDRRRFLTTQGARRHTDRRNITQAHRQRLHGNLPPII